MSEPKPCFSLEVFPPRNTDDSRKIYEVLEDLSHLQPDFINVTYGAGGSKNSDKTLEIVSLIQNHYHIKAIVHLPCIHKSQEEVLDFLDSCAKIGVKDILALRGDKVENAPVSKDFTYASDLVRFIESHKAFKFEIYGACYPEKHSQALDWVSDMKALKIKVDAGVSRLFTQLFLDNDDFYAFKEKCALVGINVPIHAGIMPIINVAQARKITAMCGSKIPPKFERILQKYADKPKMMCEAGTAYAVDQIVDLLTRGVDGIHLYVLNNASVARKIYESIHCLLGRSS